MKTSLFTKLILTGTAFCAIISTASAQTIVDWYLGGYGGNWGAPPPSAALYATSVDESLVSVNDFQLANGATTAAVDFGLGGGYAPVIGIAGGINLNNLDSLKYTSFAISAMEGQQLNVQGLTYAMWNPAVAVWGGLDGSPTPTNAMWGYRVNAGEWTLQNGGSGISLSTTEPSTSADYLTWNFQPFSTTGTVEFALWAWGGDSDFTEYAFMGVGKSIDNGFSPSLSVNGTVSAVPEPSAYVLVLVAVCAFAIFRRRTNAQKHQTA